MHKGSKVKDLTHCEKCSNKIGIVFMHKHMILCKKCRDQIIGETNDNHAEK
jgi:hypothetical protein